MGTQAELWIATILTMVSGIFLLVISILSRRLWIMAIALAQIGFIGWMIYQRLNR